MIGTNKIVPIRRNLAHEFICGLLESVLPRGKGLACVLMLKSYADESSFEGFPQLRVAGYLMTDDQFRQLDLAWGAALGDLPYFHMSEGHHKSHPDIYKALLRCLTPSTVRAGFSVSVNETYFNEVVKARMGNQTLKYYFGGAYSFCIGAYMQRVGDWVSAEMPDEKYVAYFFDGGHARQGEAEMFTKIIAVDPFFDAAKERRHYGTHTFLDGKSELGKVLQAGDILAWHLNVYHRTGQICEELKYLWEIPTHYVDYDKAGIEESIFGQIQTHEKYKKAKLHGKLRA